MTGPAEIGEIVATYQKHGWLLRRVLLSAALKESLGGEPDALFGGVPVIDAMIDAAWFSRPPRAGAIAWEIRYLGDVPFALLENIDEDDPGFENALKAVESRLFDTIASKKAA
jgi:hypothetical protein